MQQLTQGVLHCKWNAVSCDTADSVLKRVSYKPDPSGMQHNERAHQEYTGSEECKNEFWGNIEPLSVLHLKICFLSCETIDSVRVGGEK